MWGLLILLAAWMALGTVLVAWLYRPTLLALWREPVFKRPILIVESDDWGPAGHGQAERLERLAGVLGRYRDHSGRSPVLTLGVVLAIPDSKRISADGRYHRLLLSDERSGDVLRAIRNGIDGGVFSPQLHGMEHYWPEALMSAASEPRVREWLMNEAWPATEALPAALQSRWTDVSTLPSRPLPLEKVDAAVAEETAAFASIFGEPARVVVPPTFVWEDRVERAWAAAGVHVVVTPGVRYEGRDRHGALDRAGPRLYNGTRAASGLTYLVRDDYFEPSRGHQAEDAVDALAAKTRSGRPTLLETHRSNFVGDPGGAEAALHELARMLELVLKRFPQIAFLSTGELSERIARKDRDLIEQSIARRVHIWLVRLSAVSRMVKIAWLTGIMLPAWLLFVATGRAREPITGAP